MSISPLLLVMRIGGILTFLDELLDMNAALRGGGDSVDLFPLAGRLVLTLARRRMVPEERVGGTKRTPPLAGASVVVTGMVVMIAALGVGVVGRAAEEGWDRTRWVMGSPTTVRCESEEFLVIEWEEFPTIERVRGEGRRARLAWMLGRRLG